MFDYQKLRDIGQSLWYDNIHRRIVLDGSLKDKVSRGIIRGVTSNPSIFYQSIANSKDYDDSIQPMAWAGCNSIEIYNQLVIEDIQKAADIFLGVYYESNKNDGYVSLEVNPNFAYRTKETIEEAALLWKKVKRPNLMIKIPATREGLPAITATIASGINVNATLIFSLSRYEEVIEAYISGLERSSFDGQPVHDIASVASFFISRIDTEVDSQLEKFIKSDNNADIVANLFGKAAIANAKLAYKIYQDKFAGQRFVNLEKAGAKKQRPLWASTSTKNPAYNDVLYVEELIGENTINTVPPNTLDAFLDHGLIHSTIEGNLDESREILANLENLGISMDKVTSNLEGHGVSAFNDAYNALIEVIENKRLIFSHELGDIKHLVKGWARNIESNAIATRLIRKEPDIWTGKTEDFPEILKRMGWLNSPKKSLLKIDHWNSIIDGIKHDGIKNCVVLGMGGSSLAPEVYSEVFDANPSGLSLAILDSTHPDQVKSIELINPVSDTIYIVSSKSGTTTEVSAFLEYFWQKAKSVLGAKAGDHFIAITDPGTPLENLARDRNFRAVILADHDVGGRFSALTAFGLVPASIYGIDTLSLLHRSSMMMDRCHSSTQIKGNPAGIFGTIIGESALMGKDKLTIIADPELESMAPWLEQLIAESSGKNQRGVIPVVEEPRLPINAYSNDRLFIYLKMSDAKSKFISKLKLKGHPVLTVEVRDKLDIGAEFYRWEFAIAIACAILKVNAFDQPNVQDSKVRTAKILDLFLKSGQFNEGAPIWKGSEGSVFGGNFNLSQDHSSVKDVIKAFLSNIDHGCYISILAYLPKNKQTLSRLQKFRNQIGKMTRRPTTLGFGPRYLHSTGQLHKGGPKKGLFIQITSDPENDLMVPGLGYSFGTLLRAQALGDLEALKSAGQKAIRINLPDNDLSSVIWTNL